MTRQGFTFPYGMHTSIVHRTDMEPLGYNGTDNDVPPGPHMMSQSLRQGYLIRLADARMVPTDPRIRVRVA